ncbi:MAG: DNA polymerase I, partial [Planctomycetia bacterium]
MSQKKTMYLVDSHSLIFQVFHAIPPMTSPTGIPTNAVFGFARDMMFLRSKKPDFLACAWDKPEPTFRSEIYQEYKAHRDPPPDDLLIQLPLIEELCRVLNIPILGISGYEADDILATIARMSSGKDVNTYLCTTDKDCRQLITDHVFLYNLRKQMEFGKKELLEDWGVTPEQVVDLQTLVGDSVDNIPGATGIGIKTASTLLQQYGNLENIFGNIANISGTKRKENLEAFREKAPMVRKLVELCQNAPVSEDWENWSVRDIHAQEALDFFKKLGFRGLQSQMEKLLSNSSNSTFFSSSPEIPFEKPSQTSDYPVFNTSPTRLEISAPIKLQGFDGWKHEYETILTAEQLEQLIHSLNQCGLFAFDLETTGLDPIGSKIVGIAFAWEPHKAFYVPLLGPEEAKTLPYAETLSKLKPLLESPACKKINQNIKFDILTLKSHGIEVQGIGGDSMVAHYLLHSGERSHSLDELSKKYLNHEMIPITDLIGVKGKSKKQKLMNEVDLDLITLYACEDADAAFQLGVELEKQIAGFNSSIDNLKTLYHEMEIPLIQVLAQMQHDGIRVDAELLRQVSGEMEKDLDVLQKEIFRIAGGPFHINSLPQLRKVLYEDLGLPTLRKTGISKEASTDQETLEKLAVLDHPGSELPRKILEYRQVSKLKSTYVDALPEMVHPKTGRVHASFNQTITATGRLSSSDPNLQNIPVRREKGQQIRKAFIAREGWNLVSADYSQIELRLVAHFCNDPNMVEAFKKDKDIHSQVAAEVFNVPETMVTPDMRRTAKMVNFGIIYGISAHGLAQRLGIPRDDASHFIDTYFQRFPKVLAYQDGLLEQCRKT